MLVARGEPPEVVFAASLADFRSYSAISRRASMHSSAGPSSSQPWDATRLVGASSFKYGLGVDAWPLVGRSEEVARLARAVVGHRGAVITGSVGVGKTTLARTGLAVAEERGMSVVRITATRASRESPAFSAASLSQACSSSPPQPWRS
jgi:hypothetical protein